MKRIFVVLISLYIATLSPVSAMAALGSVGAGMATALLPIIKPIADKTLGTAVEEIQGTILGTKCPIGCRGPLALPCKTSQGLSTCKAVCQKIQPFEGYELKIRFGEDWSLAKCVRHRVQAGKNKSQGKGNLTSIALYSQEDLHNLLNLIALKAAAREIVDSNGSIIENKQLKSANINREEAVKEAQELVQHITQSIEKNVKDGLYGNQ